MQRRDAFYASTILHFQNLMKRYGRPVIVLNLVKSDEKRARESILGNEFSNAIHFLNSTFLENDSTSKRLEDIDPNKSEYIYHIKFDMYKAHKR